MEEIQIPHIPEEEFTPTVQALLSVISQCVEVIREQREEIQQLKDEIARLKGGNPKPKIRASALEGDFAKIERHRKRKRRNRNKKRIEIHQEITLKPDAIPKGSIHKGYKYYTVYDIMIRANNIRYRRENWKTLDGKWIIAPLPAGITGHYGAALKQHILHLNYELNVPQHLILESITDLGIRISAGELSNILTKEHDMFHAEKERLLDKGIKLFPHISVDDTGARHRGRNGFCTHIGNEFFSYFKSTESKSRLNFLRILRGEMTDYRLIDESFLYMETQKLSNAYGNRLKGANGREFADDTEWEAFLKMVGIRGDKEIKIVTEAAFLGSILSHGINTDLVIISDEAGQFDVLQHALCWLHAERKLAAILPINDFQSAILKGIRTQVWNFYNELKAYKRSPCKDKIQELEAQFDAIFTQTTNFETIDKALRHIYENKRKLLLVLARPEIPLHNNESENAIRVYVTKRKVQGGTRSDDGRRCRDTFISILKTCRKLGLSFREYLSDRLRRSKTIKPLDLLMIEVFQAQSSGG
jgi:hypothetical protein